MFVRSRLASQPLAINVAGATPAAEFYFPRAVRILRYFDVPNVVQAAHATITVEAVFTNAGTGGAGATVLATLTNNSGSADSSVRKSAGWVAHDAMEINTEARPGVAASSNVNSADEIAAGTVIKVVITGAGTTPTASVHHVGIEWIESD